jgi:hypothetical protein
VVALDLRVGQLPPHGRHPTLGLNPGTAVASSGAKMGKVQ